MTDETVFPDPRERAAWRTVADAASRCLALPEEHSMERAEIASAFHEIQRWLLARPARRVLYDTPIGGDAESRDPA